MTIRALPPFLAAACALPLPAAAQQVVLIQDVTPVPGMPSRLPPLKGARWLRGEAFAFGGQDAPRVTLLVPANDAAVLHTDSGFLADLLRRYRERGLGVVGVAEGEPGERALERWPAELPLVLSRPMVKALQPGHGFDPVCIVDREGNPLWYGPVDSGIGRWIEKALAGEAVREAGGELIAGRLEHLGEIEDHDDGKLASLAGAMIEANPSNPEGWILRLILAVERQVDPKAARAVAAEAFQNLGMDPAALSRFVEKMLRTVADDRKLLQQAFVALVPVAALAEHDVPLQLTYLKVLNALKRRAEAERLAKRLLAEAEERPELRGPLAEAMAFGAQPELFAEPARKLIEEAVRADPLGQELRYIQYLVLLRCCGDEAAADAALRPVLERGGSLNNTAWYMMTMDQAGRGRFHSVALALCRRMLATEKLGFTEQDTVALAYHLNGLHEEAVELQEKAAAASSDPAYKGRLERYRKALELREGRK